MSGAQEPVGTLEVALAHAAKLLTSDPTLAAEQADEVLKVAPGNPVAMVILGASHRARGDAPAALAILEPLARAYPDWVTPHYELGLALGLAGRSGDAVAALRRAVAIKPEMGDAWRALGDHLNALGDVQGADSAYAQHIKAATRDPRLLAPAAALCDGKIPVAEQLLRQHLKRFPTDVVAIRMLAEVAARLGRYARLRDVARPVPGAGSGLQRGPAQLCAGAAAAGSPRRSTARGGATAAGRPDRYRRPEPQGRIARQARRVQAVG